MAPLHERRSPPRESRNVAELAKERTLTDAEHLKGDAEYNSQWRNSAPSPRLELTEAQVEAARESMESELRLKEAIKHENELYLAELGRDAELRISGRLAKADNGYAYFVFGHTKEEQKENQFGGYYSVDPSDERKQQVKAWALSAIASAGYEPDERHWDGYLGYTSFYESSKTGLKNHEFNIPVRRANSREEPEGVAIVSTYGPTGHTNHRFYRTSQEGGTLWVSLDGWQALGDSADNLRPTGDNWPNYEEHDDSDRFVPEAVYKAALKEATMRLASKANSAQGEGGGE